MKQAFSKVITTATLLGAVVLAACEAPPPESVQRGYRGTGMEALYDPDQLDALVAANTVPDSLPAVPAVGPKASDVYQNVQVLGDLTLGEFTRLMAAMTEWVSPEEGCNYCHVPGEGFEQDTLYTKKVARVMIEMTQNANQNWDSHVGGAGLTCYTCHRGNNIPDATWTTAVAPAHAARIGVTMQNIASENAVSTSLPMDPFSPYLLGAESIRSAGTTALPEGDGRSVKDTESIYSLMMHFSDALGVNCTHCHNSRAFNDWAQSSPARERAWHGIRMVREMNNEYIEQTADWLPAHRTGPLGDPLKVNCETCHQGAYKPLLGANMVADYPNLARLTQTEPAVEAPDSAAPMAAPAEEENGAP